VRCVTDDADASHLLAPTPPDDGPDVALDVQGGRDLPSLERAGPPSLSGHGDVHGVDVVRDDAEDRQAHAELLAQQAEDLLEGGLGITAVLPGQALEVRDRGHLLVIGRPMTILSQRDGKARGPRALQQG
jgi:hypothetical protein